MDMKVVGGLENGWEKNWWLKYLKLLNKDCKEGAKMKNVFIITATLFIAGCASGVTVEQYKNADYGQKLE